MGRLQDKVAIVTGAGSGLGRASAKLFAAEGAKVVVTDLNEKGGRTTVKEITRDGGEALFIKQDVASEAQWKRLIARTVKTYGRPDVLFNNAGIQFSKNVEQTTLKDWRRIMRVNVDGVFLGTKYAIGAMKRGKRGGSIINMSSTYGMVGDDLNAAYCATKAAVMNFTKAAALHCGKAGYGIRVNSIHPGAIRTPLTDRELVDITRKRKLKGTQVALKEWVAIHPIGRIGVPDDIAYGALYLASDESRFMTGAELVIDGGMLAQ
ncbi:MAG: glucose 1-dehydrogenase [Proteobacteria bacterium]|nr:glucose 1-dehydrogenase [Pseudomonadota bacterium]